MSLMPSPSGYKIKRHRKHSAELIGPCPLCPPPVRTTVNGQMKTVNEDRFQAWIEKDGLVHWRCNASRHDFTQRGLFAALGIDIDTDTSLWKANQREQKLERPTVKDLAEVKYTMRHVDDWANTDPQYVLDYWGRWHVDPDMVQCMRLGYLFFERADGPWAGFTIPHFWHTGDGEVLVKGIQVRRDDSVTGNTMAKKYHALTSSNLAGVYMDKAVCTPDETRIGRGLDVLYICEAERDALVLNTALRGSGYAACAYHPEVRWNACLPQITRNVLWVIIVQDNDVEHGARRAWELQHYLRGASIIMTPHYKQPSDMAEAEGLAAMKDWLDEQTHLILTR